MTTNKKSDDGSSSYASGNDDPDDLNFEPNEGEDDSDDGPKTSNTASKKESKHMSDGEADILLKICLNEFNNIRNTETGKGPTSTLNLKQKQLQSMEAWNRINKEFEEQSKVKITYY